jgi:hypothetical protein
MTQLVLEGAESRALDRALVGFERRGPDLMSNLLGLVRYGYGLVGVYSKDVDILCRLKILEDVLEHRCFTSKEKQNLLNRGFVFDYKEAPLEIKEDILWSYFINFKENSTYYRKFSFLCNGAYMFSDRSSYKFQAAHDTYKKTLPSQYPLGLDFEEGACVKQGMSRYDLDSETMLLDDRIVYLELNETPERNQPILIKPKYLKIKGYINHFQNKTTPIYYKGPLQNLEILFSKTDTSPVYTCAFEGNYYKDPFEKTYPLPYFIYESLYNEGEFL